jgi:hypothetical protein
MTLPRVLPNTADYVASHSPVGRSVCHEPSGRLPAVVRSQIRGAGHIRGARLAKDPAAQ